MTGAPTIAYVLPTRDRPAELVRTLAVLGARDEAEAAAAEVVVVDNGSAQTTIVPATLPNGMRARVIRLEHNLGTAARNVGAADTDAPWLVMLDDDSAPLIRHAAAPWSMAAYARTIPEDMGAIGGEILLPGGRREAGGLPEVIIGCGCLIRRELFVTLGEYDAAFDYYAEEHDLCARIIHAGYRVGHTRAIGFLHRKVTAGRSFGRIIHRLVRNNGWTLARHAPDAVREGAIAAMIDRYRVIADNEGVRAAYDAGAGELRASLDAQPRTPLDADGWDRFTGAAAVRGSLLPRLERDNVDRVRLVVPGKGSDTIRAVLHEHGVEVVDHAPEHAGVPGVIGTLSPGPMADAMDATPGAFAPWAW